MTTRLEEGTVRPTTRYSTVYGAIHEALLYASTTRAAVTPADLHLLIAIGDRDGRLVGPSQELSGAISVGATQIRRSARALTAARLVTSTSRRGVGLDLALTPAGQQLVDRLRKDIGDLLAEMAAAAADLTTSHDHHQEGASL